MIPLPVKNSLSFEQNLKILKLRIYISHTLLCNFQRRILSMMLLFKANGNQMWWLHSHWCSNIAWNATALMSLVQLLTVFLYILYGAVHISWTLFHFSNGVSCVNQVTIPLATSIKDQIIHVQAKMIWMQINFQNKCPICRWNVNKLHTQDQNFMKK